MPKISNSLSFCLSPHYVKVLTLCIELVNMCIVTSSVPKGKFDQRNIQLDRVDKLFQAQTLHIYVYDTTRSIVVEKQLHDCTMNETLFGIILDWCIMKNN